MITYSIIKKTQLEGAKRLDAEYYQPEYLLNSSKLEKFGFETLQDLSTSNITKGETPLWRGDSYFNTGVPFLRSENLIFAGVDLSRIVFVSEKVHERMKRSKILPNNVLLAIVGATIGHSGLVTDEYPEYNSNQAVAIIKPENEKFSCYLSIVLETKFCQLQIERLKGGGARDNLDLHEVRILKIPKPNSGILNYCLEQIHKIRKLQKQSQSFYSQAENLLLEELGLKNFENEGGLFSVVNLSEVKNANRMDAEYFDPKYNQLQKILKDVRCLSDVAERITKRADIQPKSEYNYIEISDVNAGNGEITSNKILGQYLPANAKIKVSGGELIVSKVRPTRGAIAIIPDNWNKDFVLSGAFSVFKIESPMREYLQVLLRSFVGKLQLEKPTTGTSYPTITDEDVGNILIPILPKPTQQKIAELAQKSHEARQKAKNLLEEAKQKVEDLIENSGK